MRFSVKSKLIKIIVTILCLITVLMTSTLLGCGNKDQKDYEINKITIPMILNEQTLVQIWNKVLEITDVQVNTIKMSYLHFRADETSIQRLYSQFYGLNAKGKEKLYQLDLTSDGELKSYFMDWDTPSDASINNPQRYFEELDKLGFSAIDARLGDGGFSIDLDFQSANLAVSHKYLDIYYLKDGEFTPLNKISFNTALHVGRIFLQGNISQKSEYWYIKEDVNKAETVEYL